MDTLPTQLRRALQPGLELLSDWDGWRCAAACVALLLVVEVLSRAVRRIALRQSGLRLLHRSGCFSYRDCASAAECRLLREQLLPGVERRGLRELRWYGALWQDGRQPMQPASSMPPQAQRAANVVAARCGWSRAPNVATVHRYVRRDANAGQGVLKGRAVAIPPHIDDRRLAGAAEAVLLLQLSGAADIPLLNREGQQVVVATAHRPRGTAVLLQGEAFYEYRHAVLWPEGCDDPDAEMVTLTLRVIDGFPGGNPDASPPGRSQPTRQQRRQRRAAGAGRALALSPPLWRHVLGFAPGAPALQFWRAIPRRCPAGGACMQWWREEGKDRALCPAAFCGGSALSDWALPRPPAAALGLRAEQSAWECGRPRCALPSEAAGSCGAAGPEESADAAGSGAAPSVPEGAGCARCGGVSGRASELPGGGLLFACSDCGAETRWTPRGGSAAE